MTGSSHTTRFRFWLWLIGMIGVIVPRRLRLDWRQEWEAELRYREPLLAEWDKLDWRHRLDLLWRSTTLIAAVRREARALDPAMPMFEVETLAAQLDASLAQERLVATLASGFGLLALLLACLGLYGILSYVVARRTREIGIRMALGAQRRDLLRLVFRNALRLALLGVTLGIPAAVVTARLVASQHFGINAADPLTFSGAITALLAVAALAAFLPARRATKVDPMVALRHD